MDGEMEKMLDVTFYRDAVLEIVLGGHHITREVCELRLNLFIRAANHYFKTKNVKCEVLEPFPICFYDRVTKTRRYDDLQSCIQSIPTLSEIRESTSIPESTWELLHWTFTNPLKIKVVKESPISGYLTDELRDETKLMTIPYPSNVCNRFQITHPIEINTTKIFLQHKGKFGSFFAYHGSSGHNFHSIIHRGLRCSLNVRSAYGPGTYLSSYLETASSYSMQYRRGYDSYPRYDPDRIRYCVAIVEVIKHPSIKVVNFGKPNEKSETPNFDDTSSKEHRYYVVNSDELMRLKHLLVFY